MSPAPIWQSIASEITDEIARGHYGPGDRLPTEAELAQRFSVNRHTVRRALADMAEAGLVRSRQGAGVFVAASPIDYPLGGRVRFHRILTEAGREAERKLLHMETRTADSGEAAALGLPFGAAVHVYEAVSLADGLPIAVTRSAFPAERLPGLLAHLRTTDSITAALKAEGVSDYLRRETRIAALPATRALALHLHLREGEPVIRTRALNVDLEHVPIEYGTGWWAGDKVTLTLNHLS